MPFLENYRSVSPTDCFVAANPDNVLYSGGTILYRYIGGEKKQLTHLPRVYERNFRENRWRKRWFKIKKLTNSE